MNPLTSISKSLSQWLLNLISIVPPATWAWRWFYVGVIGAFLVGGIVIIFLKIRPTVKARISNLCWTNVVLGLLLYFFRDQRVPYVGMDIFRFFQEIGMVIWINTIIWYARNQIPKEKLAEAVTERRTKYLPKTRA